MSSVKVNYIYTLNNNNFKAPRSFRSFNRNMVFLFSNNVPSYELVLITQTTLGNGSAPAVLLFVALSAETSWQLKQTPNELIFYLETNVNYITREEDNTRDYERYSQ